jgi:cell division GTPase FtsZ
VNAAAEVIYDLVDPNANLIFGAVVDEALHGQVGLLTQLRFTRSLGLDFKCWLLMSANA